jgi:hypothetical protein
MKNWLPEVKETHLNLNIHFLLGICLGNWKQQATQVHSLVSKGSLGMLCVPFKLLEILGYLYNVSFKILTKTATIRLNSVHDYVVRPTQSVFMQRRNILDGVTLHETVHELH